MGSVAQIAEIFVNQKIRARLCAAQLAQSEERSAFNRVVVGSIPTLGANLLNDQNAKQYDPKYICQLSYMH